MASRHKCLLAVVVPIQVALAALAWRDLGRIPATRLRGPKLFWRVFVTINPGNAVAYWLVGRRQVAS